MPDHLLSTHTYLLIHCQHPFQEILSLRVEPSRYFFSYSFGDFCQVAMLFQLEREASAKDFKEHHAKTPNICFHAITAGRNHLWTEVSGASTDCFPWQKSQFNLNCKFKIRNLWRFKGQQNIFQLQIPMLNLLLMDVLNCRCHFLE